jgi:PAS domain S-box-containing protein
MTASAPPADAPPRAAPLPRPFSRGMWLAWLALALALAITLASWRHETDRAEREAGLRFDSAALDVRDAIRGRMAAYEQVLRGGAALFAASISVKRHEWKSYVEYLRLAQRFPGIQAMNFAQVVSARQRDAHTRTIRAEGFPDYAIHPEGERPEYTPIVYLEPLSSRNRGALGYDMFSEPVRHAAMERARDMDVAALTAKVMMLVPGLHEDTEVGGLMYVPVYRNGAPQASVAERRSALAGYVSAPFRIKILMDGILGARAPHIDLEIYDGSEMSPDALMYDDGWHASGPPRFMRDLPLDLGGRTWTLRLSSTPEFEIQAATAYPRFMLLGGLGISVLVFLIVASFVTLRENEARHKAVIEAALDAIIVNDERGRIVEFNPAAERTFGYRREDALGRNLAELLIPDSEGGTHRQMFSEELARGVPAFQGQRVEVPALRADGDEFPAELAVLRTEQRGRWFFTGFVRDITERKRQEQTLRESQARLDLALQSARMGVWQWDIVEDRRYFDAQFCRLLGIDPATFTGTVEEFYRVVHPDDRETLRAAMARTVELDVLYESEYRALWPDGSVHYLAGRGRLVRDDQGRPTTINGVAWDITERKQAEVELKRRAAEIELKNRLLQESDRHKSAFLARMSHELRTPLNAIIGFADLLRQAPPDDADRAREYATDIEASGRELLALVNNMLELAKIEAGKTELQLAPADIVSLARDAVTARQGAAAEKRIAMEVDAADMDECLLDARKLRQMLDQLLSNAIKFTAEGGRVGVRICRDGSDGVIMAVSDTGIGIAATDLPRLFEPFSQLDGSLSRSYGGTGLGLALVKRLAEEHGGTVAVESEPGKGSTFTVRLPCPPYPRVVTAGDLQEALGQ